MSNWRVKVASLLVSVCGQQSQHFLALEVACKPGPMQTNESLFRDMRAIFSAAKEDFEGGYLNTLRSIVQAEVFGSELEQASELLRTNNHLPAAVIAGVVLETTLRNLCTANGIIHGKLDKMHSDLTKLVFITASCKSESLISCR